jgi:phosphoglycolate phosphatase
MTVRTLMLFGTDGVLLTAGGSERAPGAAEALAVLRQRGDTVLSLATEEPADRAQARTTAAGLDRYLDFTVGAYGSDTTDPARLVGLARDRATQAYGPVPTVVVVAAPDEVVWARAAADVVVAAVHPAGAPGAVLDGLVSAGADHLVTDLREVVALGIAYAG